MGWRDKDKIKLMKLILFFFIDFISFYAPRHQQHHNQFQSSLPNGKIELIGFVAADGALCVLRMELGCFHCCGLGAAAAALLRNKRENNNTNSMNNEAKPHPQPNHNSNSNSLPPLLPRTMNGLLCCGLEWIEWKWSLVLLSLCGLRAGPPATAPHKEDKPKQTNFTEMKVMKAIQTLQPSKRNSILLLLWLGVESQQKKGGIDGVCAERADRREHAATNNTLSFISSTINQIKKVWFIDLLIEWMKRLCCWREALRDIITVLL